MKILVFEYITGGGYSQQEIPESLAREGRLMLLALLQNLLLLQDVELVLMLDERFKDLAGHAKIKIVCKRLNKIASFVMRYGLLHLSLSKYCKLTVNWLKMPVKCC